METAELNRILENHKHWLNHDCEGWEDMRADLQDAYLRGADLQDTCLRGAILRGAILRGAILRGADLRGADLKGTDLRVADLSHTNLRGANLSGADLTHADLRCADLFGADLQGADIDYSGFPLWCGSLNANFDSKQLKQIAYHLVKAGLQSTNSTDEDRRELSKLIDYANGFHRAQECGFIRSEEE